MRASKLLFTAIIAFISTTIDDFAVMLYFFGRASSHKHSENETMHPSYVKTIVGQFIGFTIVLLISLLGMLLGNVVPTKYIELLGLIPLGVGLCKIFEALSEHCCTKNGSAYTRVEMEESQVELGDMSTNNSDPTTDNQVDDVFDVETLLESTTPMNEEGLEKESNVISRSFEWMCGSCLDAFILEVALYALMCSSDNISIYITMFANYDLWETVFVIVTFYVLLLLNCLLAIVIMKCHCTTGVSHKITDFLVPLFLVTLGICILSESVLWPFQFKFEI